MTGTIFDIKRYAVHDGPGIRTTVFLKGCPLRCWWCHNPESFKTSCDVFHHQKQFDGKTISTIEEVGYTIDSQDLLKEILKDEMYFEESNGGVTFSGGEPFMQFDFLLDMVQLCKLNGLHVTIDTSGHTATDNIKKLTPFVDMFLFDIKHFNDAKHQQLTRVSNDKILSNLNYLLSNNQNVIIRYPFIPNCNNDEQMLMALESYIIAHHQIKELHILPYHAIAAGKYERFGIINKMQRVATVKREELLPIAGRFEKLGIAVKIGG